MNNYNTMNNTDWEIVEKPIQQKGNKRYSIGEMIEYERNYRITKREIQLKLRNCDIDDEEEEHLLKLQLSTLEYCMRRIRRGEKIRADFWDSFNMENLKGMFSLDHFEGLVGGYWRVLVNRDNKHKEHKYKTWLSGYGVLGDF